MLLDDARCYKAQDLEVFNLLQHPIWVFDIEKKAMFWANDAALKLWRAKSLAVLLARDFASHMSDAASSRMLGLLDKYKKGECVTESWTGYGKGATTVKLVTSGIRIEGGRIAGLAEAEMPDKDPFDESVVRGLEILRHLPLAVRQYCINGIALKFQNPEAITCFGTANSTFLGGFVDQEIGKAALRHVQDGKEFHKDVELHTQNGGQWHSVLVRRTKDPISGEHIILQTAHGIGELIAARKDTAAANLKSEFMDVLAHEIRTPLHQIVGFIDLLGESSLLPQQQSEHVRFVQQSTSSLMHIIDNLLDSSKLEQGQLERVSITFNLTNLINVYIATAESESKEKGLSFEHHISEDIPQMFVGDPTRIRQTCQILTSNAIKFTKQGTITFRVDTGEGTIRFRVTDTGIGISETQQEHIFEKYKQANNSVRANFGGTGLGLAIAKGFVDSMDGIIGLTSELGVGSTAFFELPLCIPKSCNSRVNDEEKTKETDSMHPLHILVVEDNRINQKVVCAMLHRLGHTTSIAENGQIAVDFVHGREAYDLVLMDVQMPVLDGIEATKEIRAMGLDKTDLPIVGITASFQNSQLDFFLSIGMNHCVGKPVKLKQLQSILEDVNVTVSNPTRK